MNRNTKTEAGDPIYKEMDLVNRAFKGDRSAFGALVQAYQRPVYNMCRRYVGESEARDLAQETFLKAFINKYRFEGQRSPLPWLLTIARNLCIDRLRKAKREPVPTRRTERVQSSGNDQERFLASKEALKALEKAIEELPEGQREAIVLFHVEGLAYKEITKILDVPQGTVMTWIHRGRNALRDAMRDH